MSIHLAYGLNSSHLNCICTNCISYTITAIHSIVILFMYRGYCDLPFPFCSGRYQIPGQDGAFRDIDPDREALVNLMEVNEIEDEVSKN